ncbi:putative transcription factor B3-Domain family [Arabidopsis thaliana]
MVLKVSWGSSWPIKILRNLIFYYMEKSCWDKFLNHNGLGNNEFLTFTHKGNLCFRVGIY